MNGNTSVSTTEGGEKRTGKALFCNASSVFLVSAGVIALQLALMRYLSIATWYHFVHLVISTALLGFGASGTLLTFAGKRMRKAFEQWNFYLLLAFTLSIPLCFQIAEVLPLDIRHLLYSWEQGAWAVAYHVLIFIPFFIAGTVIGLALTASRHNVQLIYGINLAGSGAGAAIITLSMFIIPAQQLPLLVSVMGFLGATVWLLQTADRTTDYRRQLQQGGTWAIVGALLTGKILFLPSPLNVEPYKKLAHLQRWTKQSNARHIATRKGPRARIDVYGSSRLHHTLFAGLSAREEPPPQLAMLADGSYVATIFRIATPEEAEILDHTPMAVPYKLFDSPQVLLLGEAGGLNVWLALRGGAQHVTVVQSNPQITELMKNELAPYNGNVFNRQNVTVVNADPRLFLENTKKRFNLIQFAGTQALTGGTGVRSLHENFLLTREGISQALDRLKSKGLLAATRGIQTPPRDNIKLLATFVEALENSQMDHAGNKVAQYRNYLAATTLATKSDFLQKNCSLLADSCKAERLDLSWAPCRKNWTGTQINEFPGPDNKPYSYFHSAAKQIIEGNAEHFYRDWMYNVRPARDQKPYFYNFFKWSSLPRFIETYGKRWLQRLELGYVVLAFTIVEVLLLGALLILAPLRRLKPPPENAGRYGRLVTLCYFGALGTGFMMAEMIFILEMNRFLGDPIYAAAGVLTAFLIFSGLGSAVSQRFSGNPATAIALAAAGIGVYIVLYANGFRELFSFIGGLPPTQRIPLAIFMLAPVSFLMGWPFPNGLALLHRGSPSLVPWAWGINGFASVAASPLAVLIAIGYSFTSVLLTVTLLYIAAAVLSYRLPSRHLHQAQS